MKKLYLSLLVFCLVAPLSQAQTFFEYDQAGNRIRRYYTPVPDLTPTNDIDNLSFSANLGPTDFVVNLYEINNLPTSGSISFTISKLSAFSITYPTTNVTANVATAGNPIVENGNWTFSQTANFIVVSSKPGVSIPAGGQAILGFSVMRKPNVATGTRQNLTISIGNGAGGQVNPTNDLAITAITTTN